MGKRLAGLDGLRAAAVLLVMAMHSGLPVPGGHVGVNLFFALSGFLITTLLLREHATTGGLDFLGFYRRRALRLFPALFAVVGVVTLYSLLVPNAVRGGASLTGTWPTLLYVSNWVRAFSGIGTLGLYEHTWSLSIEEQFYLLWPIALWLVLRWTGRASAVAAVAVGGAVASVAVRIFLVAPGDAGYARVFNGLDTQADQLLTGCALAGVLATSPVAARWAKRMSSWLVAPALAAIAAAALLWPDHAAGTNFRVLMSVVALSAAVVIGNIVTTQHGWLARTLDWRGARWIGARSYSLYLWHYPAFHIVKGTVESHWGEADGAAKFAVLAVQWATAFALAYLSYRFVETPFLRMKDREKAVTAGSGLAEAEPAGPPLAKPLSR